MSLTVAVPTLRKTKHPDLAKARETRNEGDVSVNPAYLSIPALKELSKVTQAADDKRSVRAIKAILEAREGQFDVAVPSFSAFLGVLTEYLKDGVTDGWIYVAGNDGLLMPQLVTDIIFDDGKRYNATNDASVQIKVTCYGVDTAARDQGTTIVKGFHSFCASQVARRRVADILADAGIYKETPELKAEYEQTMERYRSLVKHSFAKQFRFTGKANQGEYSKRNNMMNNRRVVHDLDAESMGPVGNYVGSALLGDECEGAIPEHPVVRVFDLKTHVFYWVHSDNMTPYAYSHDLKDKLVLPTSHLDLLDVLTNDIGAFVDDIIEGKSAGNVIMCKGIPGVGKTLTAEVYAELIERPLYSVHTGTLGTNALAIEKNLEEVFKRAKRWDCVLLLDEADVLVAERGADIEQNAIVAVFLRTLEYFDGLMFMTTNRPDNIDEGIISRCAAIIAYNPPLPKEASRIWKVMATQFNTELDDELVASLVDMFPAIAPRDIKMLLRLVLRVTQGKGEPLSRDAFRRCAMFRAIEIKNDDVAAATQVQEGVTA